MKKILLIAGISVLSGIAVMAQSGLKFHSQNYTGLLEGEAGAAFQLQSINGVQLNTWFLGLGTGLDYYRFRTVPLFLSLDKYLSPSQRSFFISLDGGVNFLWDDDAGINGNGYKSDFTPSLYLAAGLGYRIWLKNNRDALLLNLGYSLKHVREKRELQVFCINPPCGVSVEKYNYDLNRLSLRLGFQF